MSKPSFWQGLRNHQTRIWLFAVAGVALIERLVLWCYYRPTFTNDSPTYQHLANSLRNHGFEKYNGTRTPGYPLFLMLTGTEERAYAVQLVLGFCTVLLLFYLGWRITGKYWFGALVALAHILNLGQLFFEAYILTETFSTFLLMLVLAMLAYLIYLPPEQIRLRSIFPVALVISLLNAALAMTRPLFAFLSFWIASFIIVGWRTTSIKFRWGTALLTLLPIVLVIGGWMNFIHTNFKMWGMDSIGGYHLVNHSGVFFEYVPDEYAEIRDTYLQFRAARIAQTGSQVNTIWDSIPALIKVSGLGYYGLARLLGKISMQLILEHPALYLRNVLYGWWWFWLIAIFWAPQAVTNPTLQAALKSVILLERGALFSANMLFIAGSVTALIWRKARTFLRMDAYPCFITITIWLTSILQSLIEHGDNPRFLVPLQSMVVFVALFWIWQIIETIREHPYTR